MFKLLVIVTVCNNNAVSVHTNELSYGDFNQANKAFSLLENEETTFLLDKTSVWRKVEVFKLY